MKKTINERVKEARMKLNISQSYVAKYLGINRSAVCQIENGKREINLKEVKKYSLLFNIPVDELINGRNTQSPETIFARKFKELDDKDQEEILNLIEFKKTLKRKKK